MDLMILKLLFFAKEISLEWQGRNQLAMGWRMNRAQGMRNSINVTISKLSREHRRGLDIWGKRCNQSQDMI